MKLFKLLALPLISLCCLTSCEEGAVTPFRNPRNSIRVIVHGTAAGDPYIQLRDIQYEKDYTEDDLKLWCRKLNYHYYHEEGRFPYIEVPVDYNGYLNWGGPNYVYNFPHYIKSLIIVIQYGQNKCPVLPNTQPGVDSPDPEVVDKAKKTYGYYYYTEWRGDMMIGKIREEKQEPYMYNFRISTITILYSLEGELGEIMDLDTYYWNSYYKLPVSPISPEGYTVQYFSHDLEGKERIEDKKATFDHDTTIYAYCTKNK